MQNKIQTNLVVFTGAASSGKSTTIEAFRPKGFEIRKKEVAREYIEEIIASLKEKYPNETEEFINLEFDKIIKSPQFSNDDNSLTLKV